MHRNLLTAFLGFLLFHLTVRDACSQSVQLPPGWSSSQDGANTIYKPANLGPGKVFSMYVSAGEGLAGRDLLNWFSERVEADLRQRGVSAKQTPPQRGPSGLLSETLQFHDQSGQVWTFVYAGAQTPDGPAQFCVMVSNMPQALMAPNVSAGANIFGQRVALGKRSAATPTNSVSAANSADARVTASDSAAVGSDVPRPAGGASDTHIEAVLHGGYGTTTVQGYRFIESVDLLLKDGWEYSDLAVPPEDLNIEASRKSEPQKWHHWKEQSGHYFLQEANGAWTQLQADRVRPLESGSSLSKRLMHRDATRFGGMGAAITTKTIAFFPTGRFERSAGFIGGTGAVQAGGGFSAGAASYSDGKSSRSAASGSYTGAGSSVTARSAAAGGGDGSATGTYHVSGYAVELDSIDGQRQRLLAFYPFEGQPDVYIGNVTFNVQK